MQYIKSFSNSDVAIEYIKTKLKEDATYKIFSKEDMIFPDENPDPIAEYYIIQKEID